MEGATKKIKSIFGALVAVCSLILAIFGVKKEFKKEKVTEEATEAEEETESTEATEEA